MTTPNSAPTPTRLPEVRDRTVGPLRELSWSRLVEFCREPEVIFWVYGFPILMVMALGIAFRDRPIEQPRIAVVVALGGDSLAGQAARSLTENPAFDATVGTRDVSLEQLRTGKIDLIVESQEGSDIVFHFDPTRPEAVLARDRAEAAMERAAGRQDRLLAHDNLIAEPGSRYIDFLIPGLMGLSLMGGGLWGVGFVTVEMRIRGLLKRFLATPMRRSEFLMAVMFSRMLFMIPEMLLIVLFSGWLFGVRIYGSLPAVAALVALGATTFSGLGLLAASRAKTLETVSGLLNLIMLPMWLGSGVFFARERYPDAVQPILQLLPLSALVDALRGVMLEGLTLPQIWPAVATLFVWACVSFSVALRTFRWM
jgi:ABC-2 type transport system permease protein